MLRKYFEPNRTPMIEVQLKRQVLDAVFRLTQDLTPEDFGKRADQVGPCTRL